MDYPVVDYNQGGPDYVALNDKPLPPSDESGNILYIISDDWFFLSHFSPMSEVAKDSGLRVVIATRRSAESDRLTRLGIEVIDVPVYRENASLSSFLFSVMRYYRAIRATRPRIVHCIALRSVLFGGLASVLAGQRHIVLAPTGLGYLGVSSRWEARLAWHVLRLFIRVCNRRPGCHFLFENSDDPRELGIDLGGECGHVVVPGAGVHQDEFRPSPPPAGASLRVAVAARMIEIKGIGDAVAAVLAARNAGHDVVLDLWGAPDPGNPRSLRERDLQAWAREPGINWHGRTRCVEQIWQQSHVAMLLSWGGEGMPRSLIEAAAAGRAIITTDVPGCRDVVTDGVEGFVVPVRDVAAAAAALGRLASDREFCATMGARARAKFEAELTSAKVKAGVERLYRSILADPAPGRASWRTPPRRSGRGGDASTLKASAPHGKGRFGDACTPMPVAADSADRSRRVTR